MTHSAGLKFRPDIQGLRAVAVALVVLSHAGVSGFAGGFVGVDVFFVLSGYLITGLLLDERLNTGTVRYGRFLARRMRRLLPAMLTMLVVVLLVSALLLTAYEMRMQARSFQYAATWTSNFFFAFADWNYFDALQAEDLFLHTWSLGVEEQFYLVWPWLILLFAGLRSKNDTGNGTWTNLLAALGVVFVASLALGLYLSAKSPILSFYMMPARGWQFALGAAVFVGINMAPGRQFRSTGFVAQAVGLIGALLVLGAAVGLTHDLNYPGWYALLPSFGAAFVIAAGELSPNRGIAALLSRGPVVWVGDRSYSIYLWHWPLLILGNSLGISRSPAGVAAMVATAVIIAAACYRYIEYPVWKGRFKTASPARVAQAAAIACVLAVGLSDVLERQVYVEADFSTREAGYDPRQDMSALVYGAGMGCDTGPFGTNLGPCPIGARDGKYLAILWGDSIGAQWSPTIAGIFAAPDWQVLVLTKSACAIVDKTYYYEKAGGDYVVCTEWRNKALDYIDMVEPDAMIIGSSATYDFDSEDWIGGTTRILERLEASVEQVILLPGTPRLSFNGPSCLEDPWRFSYRLIDGARECEEANTETRSNEVAGYLRQAADMFPNTVILDLGDLVCPGDLCAAQSKKGIAVFRDHQHVTASFARSVIPEVRRRIEDTGVVIRPVKPGLGNGAH